MGLDRLSARLGVVIVALVVATIVYGVIGVILSLVPGVELVPHQSFPWPRAYPPWPIAALFAAALAVAVVQAPLIVVSRSRKRRLAQRLAAEADEWLRGSTAPAAKDDGYTLIRVTGLRARALGPHEIELSWDPPMDEVDEVVVARSATGFVTSPEPRGDQVIAYSGDEAVYADTGLDDDRVYHYTAFARSRDGRWSPPAWVWATTPSAPLYTKFVGTLRTFRIPVPGSVR